MNRSDQVQRIVVGIDGSAQAARAAAWAAALAARRDATLHLVHALNLIGPPSLLTRLSFETYRQHRVKDGEALLDAVRAQALVRFPRLWITTEVAESDPVQALVACSREARLVVAGTRGHDGFAGLLLGSVALRLAAHSRCPAVFVPAGFEQAETGPIGEVVVGVEWGECAEMIDFAFDLAEETGASLRAVHAWEAIPAYNGYYYIDPATLQAEAQSLLGGALKVAYETHGANVRLTADAVRSAPATALLDAARGARLLVLGAHRRRSALSVGVGPVLHALLSHPPCPVAVVPATWHQGT